MRITIKESGGSRREAYSTAGISDEATLMKSLILALATASINCEDDVTLRIDLCGCDPLRLIEIARVIALDAKQESVLAESGEVPSWAN